jgi:cytidylate kinase
MNMLISINGLYGSGGNEMGYALAERLGYTVYDGELIEKAVADSGVDLKQATLAFYDEDDGDVENKLKDPYKNAVLSLELDVLPIARQDEVKKQENRHSGLLAMFMDTTAINVREGIPAIREKEDIDSLREAQKREILRIAQTGNAIFFGRCSSYILRGRPDALRIFTCASLDSCRERIMNKYQIQSEAKVNKLIKETNRRRAYYYEAFTNQTWDDLENYDLCLNTDYLGFDGSVDLIAHIIRQKSAGE